MLDSRTLQSECWCSSLFIITAYLPCALTQVKQLRIQALRAELSCVAHLYQSVEAQLDLALKEETEKVGTSLHIYLHTCIRNALL